MVEFQSNDDQNESNVEVEIQLQWEYGHRQGCVDDHRASYDQQSNEITGVFHHCWEDESIHGLQLNQ